MIVIVQNETPFQVLSNSFTIGPSSSGYELQVGATSRDFTTLFTVGADIPRMVTNVANGSYFRLKNNVGEVEVNWSRTCKDSGGGSGSGVTPEEVQAQIDSALTVYTPTANFATINGSAITSGGNITIEGGGDMSVLKGKEVGVIPSSGNLGDIISLTSHFEGEWNTEDYTTAKMHMELDGLDRNEVYTIAEFTGTEGPVEIRIEPDALNNNTWVLGAYWNNWRYEQIFMEEYNALSFNVPITTDLETEEETYAQILWLPDDFSGNGWMVQIGVTNGNRGVWIGTYEDIPDLVLTDIEGTDYAQGPFCWDGEKWVSAKGLTMADVSILINGVKNELYGFFDWVEESFTPTENFATINGSAITSGGNIVISGVTAELQDQIRTMAADINTIDEVLPAAIVQVNDRIDELSGNTIDLSDYYTSAQTESAISTAIAPYYTSAQTETAISSKNYVTSAQVETQIVEKNYITSAATQDMVTSTYVSTIWKGTQAQYDAITTKDPATLYIIID